MIIDQKDRHHSSEMEAQTQKEIIDIHQLIRETFQSEELTNDQHDSNAMNAGQEQAMFLQVLIDKQKDEERHSLSGKAIIHAVGNLIGNVLDLRQGKEAGPGAKEYKQHDSNAMNAGQEQAMVLQVAVDKQTRRKRSRKLLSTHNKRKSSAEPLSLLSQSQTRTIDTSSYHNNVEDIPQPHSAPPYASPLQRVNKRHDHEWKIVSPRAVACEQVVSPLHTDASPSVVKRLKNMENLEKLNCRMNSAIGIHMSPGATPSRKQNSKSLKQKRLQSEATRERLRKQFESVITH